MKQGSTIPRFWFVTTTLVLLCFHACLCGPLVCFVHAEEIDNAPARAFNAAAALQNAGLYTRATEKWKEFIAKYPNDTKLGQAHYFLGTCALREQKFAEAVALFEGVLQRWPDIPQADKAQYNLAMGRYEIAVAGPTVDAAQFQRAASDFQVVASKFPNSEFVDEALYYQADSLFSAGRLDEAVSVYQTLIAQHAASPRAARAHYDMGVAQQELKQPEEAAKTYETFLAKPEYAEDELVGEVRLRWAVCLHQLQQLDAAAEQFEKTSQIKDFALASYAAFRHGQTRSEQERYEEAARLLQELPTRFPESEYRDAALKTAGQCYYLTDKPQEAINLLTSVANNTKAEVAETAAEAAYWMARSQLKLKQPDQALATLESAIGRFSATQYIAYLQFARIDALFELPQRRPETPSLYEAFLQQHPDHSLEEQAAYMASLSAFGEKQYLKARQIADGYLSLPEHQTTEVAPELIYIGAESCLLELTDNTDVATANQQRAEAEKRYRELVAKFPQHSRVPASQLRIGWCLAAADKSQETINHLNGVLQQFDKEQQLPEAQLLIGRSHAKLSQHREAIAALNAATASNANWSRLDEVLLAQANSHRAVEELDPATELLNRLQSGYQQSPLRPQALYGLGEIAKQRERWDEAIQWFSQVADHFKDSVYGGPATHGVAAMHFAKQQFPQSREWATRLVDSQYADDLKRRGLYLRGLAFHRENQFEPAIQDLTNYLQAPVEESEATQATYIRCLCQIASKQFDQAQDSLTQLTTNKPDFAQADVAYYELGHALFQAKAEGQAERGEQALKSFQWITEKRPDSPLAAESWFRIAQAKRSLAGASEGAAAMAAFQEAETAANAGLQKQNLGPLREKLLFVLGDVQWQQQKYAPAAESLNLVINEFPNGTQVGPALFLAGQARYKLDQFDAALPLFLKATEANFSDVPEEQIKAHRSQSWYYAGQCAAKLNRWPESQSHYQRLVDQFPEFPQIAEVRYAIAHSLQQQNQLPAAEQAYEQVAQMTETETAAKARFMLGEIKFGRGEFEAAIEQFLTVTVGYPYESWQALARFETARCFRELGDVSRAQQTLREMIEKHPQHPRRSDAERMLQELTTK